MGRRFLDNLAALRELMSAQDIAATDDNRELYPAIDQSFEGAAMARVSSILIPLLPPCPKASPLILSSTRPYFGFG